MWVREVYKLKADGSSSRKMSHSLSDLQSQAEEQRSLMPHGHSDWPLEYEPHYTLV